MALYLDGEGPIEQSSPGHWTLAYGNIGNDTTHSIELRYVASETNPVVPLGLFMNYGGDEGAFELTSIGMFSSPGVALESMSAWSVMAAPEWVTNYGEFSSEIKALGQDLDTEMTGQIFIGDLVDIGEGVTITRVLGKIDLSKTWTD